MKAPIITAAFISGALLCAAAQGQELQPLQAKIEKAWTVDSAREEAFREAEATIDPSPFPKIDPNLIENRQIVTKGGGKINGRVITVFSSGGYAVQSADAYKYEINTSFFYAENGSIEAVGIEKGIKYPKKTYKYTMTNDYFPTVRNSGDLVSVHISVKSDDTYTFSPAGKLLAHWICDKCYNLDGSSCGWRESHSE